jgi:hypothetical protein
MELHEQARLGSALHRPAVLGSAWLVPAGRGMERNLMSPFKPQGEIAQWRIAYDAFKAAAVGDEITYARLGELLDIDAGHSRHRIQAAARRAAKKLLLSDDRAVETVPETGYRIVPAVRQIPMAGQQVERATRALEKGHDLSVHIRLDELSETEREVVRAMAAGFSQVAEWARQIGRRVDDHEGRLSDIEAELKRLRDDRAK